MTGIDDHSRFCHAKDSSSVPVYTEEDNKGAMGFGAWDPTVSSPVDCTPYPAADLEQSGALVPESALVAWVGGVDSDVPSS